MPSDYVKVQDKLIQYHYSAYASVNEATKDMGEETLLKMINEAVKLQAKANAYARKLRSKEN